MEINQKKLSKLAGVSQSTISRVLNNDHNVSPEIKVRVEEVIKKYGYRPNALARALVKKKTNTVGILVHDIQNAFFVEVVRGIQDCARDNGYTAIIYNTDNVSKEEEEGISTLLEKQVDGIIIATVKVRQETIDKLNSIGKPFVLVNRETHANPCDFVVSDNYSGALQAVNHLFEHGYQHIAHIAGPRDFLATWERFEAYMQVFDDNGLKPKHEYIKHGDLSLDSGYDCMKALLGLNNPPRAVFVGNDMMAIGAIEAISDRKLRVPEDVAIVGFDDIRLSSLKIINLTTVRQQKHRMGEEAIKLFMERSADMESPARGVRLATELIIRKSCGCP